MRVTLREAAESDIPTILTVLDEATRYKLDHDDLRWSQDGWTAEEITGSMSRGNTFYLALHNDKAIGTVSLAWRDPRSWGKQPDEAGYVHKLAVRGAYHGKEIGSQMLDQLAHITKASGRKYIRLDCDARNRSLCTYYEQRGFTRVGSRLRPELESDSYCPLLYQRSV